MRRGRVSRIEILKFHHEPIWKTRKITLAQGAVHRFLRAHNSRASDSTNSWSACDQPELVQRSTTQRAKTIISDVRETLLRCALQGTRFMTEFGDQAWCSAIVLDKLDQFGWSSPKLLRCLVKVHCQNRHEDFIVTIWAFSRTVYLSMLFTCIIENFQAKQLHVQSLHQWKRWTTH